MLKGQFCLFTIVNQFTYIYIVSWVYKIKLNKRGIKVMPILRMGSVFEKRRDRRAKK